MAEEPITNGGNGRGPDGKFAKGNSGGPGSPYVKKVASLRSALFKAVTAADFKAVVRKLVEQAKGGDVAAIKLLLDRCLGPAEAIDFEERLERLEELLLPDGERK